MILRSNYHITGGATLQQLISESPSLLGDLILLFSEAPSLSLLLLARGINQEVSSIWNLGLSLLVAVRNRLGYL